MLCEETASVEFKLHSPRTCRHSRSFFVVVGGGARRHLESSTDVEPTQIGWFLLRARIPASPTGKSNIPSDDGLARCRSDDDLADSRSSFSAADNGLCCPPPFAPNRYGFGTVMILWTMRGKIMIRCYGRGSIFVWPRFDSHLLPVL